VRHEKLISGIARRLSLALLLFNAPLNLFLMTLCIACVRINRRFPVTSRIPLGNK